MIGGLETAASYGPKSALVLDEPVHKHGSEAADRLVMTSAEQCSDLDQETARIRASKIRGFSSGTQMQKFFMRRLAKQDLTSALHRCISLAVLRPPLGSFCALAIWRTSCSAPNVVRPYCTPGS
jgi:hypothetical protein